MRAATNLLAEAEAAEKEAHSEDEEQVGQDRAEKGGLHNTYFILQ